MSEQTSNTKKQSVRAPVSRDGATLRRRVYEVIELGRGDDKLSVVFDVFIVSLILLNIAAFVAESVPSLYRAYGREFEYFEIFSVAIFTIEYIARLWVAVEVPFLSRMTPWRARLKFAGRSSLIIDLLAIAPFYLSQLINIDLRVLRILRLLRFLKLSRYSPAMHTLLRVLSNEKRALAGAALLLMGALLFASTGIYFLESEAQPDKFASIPDAAWWAMATLTTVGYGDLAPITYLGRLFGGVVMIAGLCILALPVAIISTGFAQEVGRRDFVVNWSLISRIPLLAELDHSEIAKIMPLLHAHNLPPNVEVLSKGSPGNAMYFVAAGKVELRSENTARKYETGDFFGVVAMLEDDVNRGSFVTVSRTRLLKLHKEDFAALAMANPEVASHLREIAQARMQVGEEGDISANVTG